MTFLYQRPHAGFITIRGHVGALPDVVQITCGVTDNPIDWFVSDVCFATGLEAE